MDILREFRDLTIEGQRGEYTNNTVVFPNGKTFNGTVQVPLSNGTGRLVSIASLWHLIYCADQKFDIPQYLSDAKARGIANVSVTVRDELVRYITGVAANTNLLQGVNPAAAETSRTTIVKRKKLSEYTIDEIIATEVPITKRNNALINAQLSIPITSVMDSIKDLNTKSILETASTATNTHVQSSFITDTGKPPSTAIIIVPSGKVALFNLLNVADFFLFNRYVSTATGQPSDFQTTFQTDPKFPHLLRVLRLSEVVNSTKKVPFYFCDNPSKLTPEQWQRVVGVIVSGQQWQLQTLKPLGNSPTEVFAKVPGFYFYFEGEPVHESVLGLNIKKIALSRNKRHDDAVVAAAFWKEIISVVKARSQKTPMYF